MTTSGTYAFNLDIVEIIEEAYERAGHAVTQITGRQLATARRSLNLMFTDWANEQINLWTVEPLPLAMVVGTQTYALATGTSDVLDVYLRRAGTDIEMTRMSRDEYALRPNKTSPGRPTQFFIERFTDLTQMTVWQSPENATDVVFYYRIRHIQDAGIFTNNVDAPQRWLEAVCAGLAYKLAVKRPKIETDRLRVLRTEYGDAWERARGEDRERATTRIIPAVERRS